MGTKIFSVLMGDIEKSRAHLDNRKLFDSFNKIINRMNVTQSNQIESPLTITLGDEFQGVVTDLSNAFTIAVLLRHRLLEENLSCRFVIGRCEIQSSLNREKAWNMLGTGLVEARDLLNNKIDDNCYRFSLISRPEEDLLNGLGLALTLIERSWTKKQLEYVSAAYGNKNELRRKLAKKLKTSENSFYKVLRAAEFTTYSRLFETIHSYLISLDLAATTSNKKSRK